MRLREGPPVGVATVIPETVIPINRERMVNGACEAEANFIGGLVRPHRCKRGGTMWDMVDDVLVCAKHGENRADSVYVGSNPFWPEARSPWLVMKNRFTPVEARDVFHVWRYQLRELDLYRRVIPPMRVEFELLTNGFMDLIELQHKTGKSYSEVWRAVTQNGQFTLTHLPRPGLSVPPV